ncbi:rhomboid family intramembrane serine protease [Flavobacteriaceae bacterium AH-315-B10]|nr:rhomboid family intramembrane serine protease [Flavobacteriaceae bacterium AH-315-B10]
MTSLNYDIKNKLKNLSAFEKIIALNIVVYFVGWLLYQTQSVIRQDSLIWLALPKDFSDFILKPWSILTYGFAHIDLWHLFINLLILYFVGRLFSNLFNIKLSLNVYFLGILFGGLAYMLVYTLFPNGILKTAGPLVGASAGVRAALIFLCAYMPNKEMRLVTINIKLMYIGLVLVALDVLGLFGNNSGGNVAHLGGDLLGYFYAVQLQKGRDIGKGFERFMDAISSFFSIGKKSNLKTVYKSKKKGFAGHTKQEFGEFNKQKQIDIILDKISKSGYESLSKEEKAFLFKTGKK